MIRAVALMDFEANDLSAIDIQDDVQIKPSSHNLAHQEREIPTPQLSRGCGHVCARRPHSLRYFAATSMPKLPMRSEHATEAGFAGDIGSLIGQHRYDSRRRQLGKSRLVGNLHDSLTFRCAQCVRASRPYSSRTAIAIFEPLSILPSLQSAWIDPGDLACSAQA